MRVAICIWGLLRSLRYTIDSFEEHILTAFHRYNVSYDIYVHTYNISGSYQNTRNHEKSVTLNISEWQLLRPNYIYIENQDELDSRLNYSLFESSGDPWHNDFASFKNHMRALNSLYHLTQVVESAHIQRPYDAVVFLRPDVRFLTDLPLQLLFHASTMQETDLFVPDFHRSCQGNEFNDRMALGKVEAVLTYGKKFETAYEFSLHHKLHAEKFTYHQLTTYSGISPLNNNSHSSNLRVNHHGHGLRVREVPFRFQRIRASGDIHLRDYEAVTPAHQAHLEQQGEYFVGHGKRTPWILRMFYTLLEVLTLGQVYVWNHDDHGNVFCHPHPYIDPVTLHHLQQHYSQSSVSAFSAFNQPEQQQQDGPKIQPVTSTSHLALQGRDRIVCAYDIVPYSFTATGRSIESKYVRAHDCRFESRDASARVVIRNSEASAGGTSTVISSVSESASISAPSSTTVTTSETEGNSSSSSSSGVHSVDGSDVTAQSHLRKRLSHQQQHPHLYNNHIGPFSNENNQDNNSSRDASARGSYNSSDSHIIGPVHHPHPHHPHPLLPPEGQQDQQQQQHHLLHHHHAHRRQHV